MPVSKYYTPVSGQVKIPDPNDPYNVSVTPGMTTFEFGAQDVYAGQRGGMRPVTEREKSADALLKARLGIPDMPSDLSPELSNFMRQPTPPMPQPLTTAKPADTYGTNRGGTGKAGRGVSTPQFGESGFDTQAGGMSIADLRKLDDKPWELDENTNADVAPGTSFEPQKDNVTDRQPDLNSPAGLYEALSKKYPDILQRNLDEMEKGRVTMEDVDALRDRAGLGSLFIAASKAASGAGTLQGKSPESIAEKIVTREDSLARQQLKDRLDVASENMQMNAKAVDLAMKQINFADEREQYDPNSEVSRFARDFMRSEFELKIPDNVPAYQLKQFLPAMMQKYQTKERIAYQNALLGQKTTELDKQLRAKKDIAGMEIQGKKDITGMLVQGKKDVQAMKPPPGSAAARMLTGTNIPKDVADKEMAMTKAFNDEPAVKKFKTGNIALQEMKQLSQRNDPYGDQGLINGYAKILDPESVVREGEYKVVERGGGVLDSIKNRLDIAQGKARLQPAQRQMLIQAAQALQDGRKDEYNRIKDAYKERASQYGLESSRVVGRDETAKAGGGLSEEKKKRLEELRAKLKGGQ